MNNIFKSLFNGKKQNEEQVKAPTANTNVKCKECGMQFRAEDILRFHKKKAHSSKEERKKKN